MNDDHGDSILVYAKHYAKLPSASKASISDMSHEGLTLDVTMSNGEMQSGIYVPYSRPMSSVKDVRPIVVEMHHEAYHALGHVYKMTSGYYKKEAKNKIDALKKKYPLGGKLTIGVAAVSIGTLCILAFRKIRDAKPSIKQ